MSTVWKAVTATIGVIVVGVMTYAMMAGFASEVDARWALASFGVFIVAGITGLLTGTEPLMKHLWSRVVLYILSAALLVITVTNVFLNSQEWFVALAITVALLWLEFTSVDLLTHDTTPAGPRPTHFEGI